MTTKKTDLPAWMQLPWYEAMNGAEWLEHWAKAEERGNTVLAIALLHVAFQNPQTCIPEVADKVLLLADGGAVYRHKQECSICNAYLMRGAGSAPCAVTKIAEKARHTLILGLLRTEESHIPHTRWALGWMKVTDPHIGTKVMTFLWDNQSWLQLNKQEMQIATDFLEHIDPSWLRMRDDLEGRKLFFRVLCLWGLAGRIEPINPRPDPVNVRLLEEIAIERNDAATALEVYQKPNAAIYCRIAAERALALSMLVPRI